MPSFRRLPSGKWQGVVKHPSGKRYTRTDPLRRVVVEWAQQLELDIRRGEFIDPRSGRMTLGEWWVKWSTSRVVEKATRAKGASVWKVHVEPAFGGWPLSSIQPWDVEAWVGRLDRESTQKGAESRASAVRLLKQLLGEAARHKLIRVNPAEGVKTPDGTTHVDRFMSIGESDRLVAAVTMPDRSAAYPAQGEKFPRVPDPANQLLIRTMLDAGLRFEEAAGLHGFRLDLLRGRVRVQEVLERDGTVKGSPKSKAGERTVPLTDELVESYAAHMTGRPRDGLVFTERAGGPINYSNWLKRVWNPAVKAAGLETPLPTPHDCRHSYGSWLADQGVPPHEIAALMGHASLRSVERYLHASEARMGRARDALGARRAHDGPRNVKEPRLPGGGNGA